MRRDGYKKPPENIRRPFWRQGFLHRPACRALRPEFWLQAAAGCQADALPLINIMSRRKNRMSVFFYGCITLDGYLAASDHNLDWLFETEIGRAHV